MAVARTYNQELEMAVMNARCRKVADGRAGAKASRGAMNLNWVLIGEQVDDVECVLNDADSHQLRRM